ncbi:hypothetical protein ACE01N_20325 [Saccharicrinis sp. FJH2]|uniref:hypothetical protein n=1 Tax=Saccharicrinis sp. FJH65 TaxID=3344659 RepID=UPI0035F36D64
MNRILAIQILILFSLLYATGQEIIPLENDKLIQKYFSDEEIINLKLITNYFDKIVLDWSTSPETNKAYHEYLDYIVENIDKKEVIYQHINPNLQNRVDLFDTLETNNFFNEIWKYENVTRVSVKDTTLINPPNFETLELNIQGKYFDYLKKLSRKDKNYHEVYKSIMASGAIGPYIRWWSIRQNNLMNYNKEYNRLFLAISLFSYEDWEVKVSRYLQIQK